MDDCAKMASFPLFRGFTAGEVGMFVSAPSVHIKAYGKGDVLLHEGERCGEMGLILEGGCIGETVTESGRREVAAYISEGGVFGEVLAMSDGGKSPVTVTAASAVRVMYIPFEKLLSGDCLQNAKLLKNLTAIISKNYFSLLFRVNCLSKPSLREKILYYLHETRVEYGSDTFSIPFDRSGLADFLSADRSALSRELSRLKAEGVIDFYKNTFNLKGRYI